MEHNAQTGLRHAGPIVDYSGGAVSPLGVGEVRLTGGFWGERQELNAQATLDHCLRWMDRVGWVGNFDRAAVGGNAEPYGREFADSEVYKLLEALAWESARSGETRIEEMYRSLVARVLAAQSADGYLNTRFGGPNQPARYSNLEWGHELYCAGHFIQAAVARARTFGQDELVRAAIRFADHICETFGDDGNRGICGHPEIEVALVELSRVTDDDRYLNQARIFVERRGHGLLNDPELPASYFLDDLPVRDADVLRGHAVRALYLAAGAVDVATATHDDELLQALETQWTNTVAKRTYITGGMGARHYGESFGEDFELPSSGAYSETCAAIGSIMFSWRMLLAAGDERYADLIERTLFNVVATSPDEHGTAFFYVNPLQRDAPGVEAMPDEPSSRASSSQRAPWFGVSCCPTNVARTLASLSGYVATVSATGLQLHQYAGCEISTNLPDGRPVSLSVATSYPDDGRVAITIDSDSDTEWTLSLRIPHWALGTATVTDNGSATIATGTRHSITRAFHRGEEIVLDLPIEPRVSFADPRVDDVRDSAAIEAGPLVYCLESVDQPRLPLSELLLDWRVIPSRIDAARHESIIGALGRVLEPARNAGDAWPYGAPNGSTARDEQSLRFIPYHRWAERGPSTMRVFVPVVHDSEREDAPDKP